VPDVDVVVVSYNSREELRDCVGALAGQAGINVFVVDSASPDDSLEAVADLPVAAVPLPENRGFGFACNVGWRRGSAPYVLFLNPDATIDPASLFRLAELLEANPRAGAVAPRIVDPDGKLDFSLRRFPRARSTFAQAFFLHRLWPQTSWSDEVVRDVATYERPGSPEWASGACLLTRRSLLERLGGFDEAFFLYCEDRDLCFRIRREGFDIRYEPAATAVHEGGASAPRTALLPVLAASRVRYARKHLARPAALLERVGIAFGALTHAILSRGGAPARRGHLRALRRVLSARPRMGVALPERQRRE
jgi:N-acetylglucosaminyl-diphospho-decaprenol L-rhamnosyltransferase